MKVLLIKPTPRSDSITPPLGLGYLATALRPTHEVSILDGPNVKLNPKMLQRVLEEFAPDVVGFNLVSMDLYITADYLRIVRAVKPGAVTIVGGPHPSGEPEETFHYLTPDLDYAFVGEAEKGLPMLLEMLPEGRPRDDELGRVPGLVWRGESGIIKNPAHIEQNLDSLGIVAWDLLPPATYPHAPHAAFAMDFPVGYISSTRGCPFNCEFCAARAIQGRKIRRRSLDHVMGEVELLVEKYGIRELHIVDDNFTYNRDYALEFCELVASKFPGLWWTCPNGVRLDSLDAEMLAAMKRSGCHSVAVGIESGNQFVLDSVNKKQTLDLIRERVHLINEAGINPIGFFGIGFPGETEREIRQTIEFSMRLPLIRAQYMFFHPMPGTDQYRKILREHPEKIRRLHTSLEKVAYVEDGLTASRLKWLQRVAFLKFYLRPRQFLGLLSSIHGPEHAYHIANRIFHWMVME